MSDVKNILKRMKQALDAKNLAEVSQKLGVSEHTINTWRQRGEIPEKHLLKCTHMNGINYDWLLTGKGEMYLPSISNRSLKGEIRDYLKDLEHKDESVYHIPALSVKAAAGEGNNLESIDAFESFATINIDKMLFKTAPTQKLRAIQVDGYSMAPMLMPDSWVIFELDRGYDGDGLYIINWRNILMVKKVQLNMGTGRFEIISTNPDYDSYSVDPDDQSVFRIIGKVIRAII